MDHSDDIQPAAVRQAEIEEDEASALVALPHLTGIVLLWSAGLTLALPLPLYLGAFAALLVAIAAELRRPERRPRAAAMAILLAAGVVPQSSAHALLAVVALAALAEPAE